MRRCLVAKPSMRERRAANRVWSTLRALGFLRDDAVAVVWCMMVRVPMYCVLVVGLPCCLQPYIDVNNRLVVFFGLFAFPGGPTWGPFLTKQVLRCFPWCIVLCGEQ